MKKIISVLLAILMVFSLTACSSGDSDTGANGDVVTLKMWAHQNEPWNNAYRDAIAAFEAENEGIKIELETFPYNEFESKVQTSLIDGDGGADIYELWGGWALDFAPTGSLLAMPDDFASQIKEETYAPTYGALTYEDKIYGVPLEFNIENGGMLVNLHLMEEKGLSIPTTWDELVKTAKEGTEHDGNIYKVKGLDFVNWDSVPYYFLSLTLQQGANYLTEDGKFNVETPEAKKAFEILSDLVVKDKVTDLEGLTGGGDLEGYQQLYANRALMVTRGPWAISEGVESFGLTLGTDFDYVAAPWLTDNHAFASETGWSLALNSKTANSEAAMKFLKYMYSDEVMSELNVRCTQIPSKKSIASSSAYQEAMPYTNVLLGILDNAQFIGNFNTDRLKESINGVFEQYCSGEYASLDDAISDLNTKLNDILK